MSNVVKYYMKFTVSGLIRRPELYEFGRMFYDVHESRYSEVLQGPLLEPENQNQKSRFPSCDYRLVINSFLKV